ncbi:hypothetical protein BDW75DRAFT_219921 [Aspergillus navahoensis]
MPSLWAVGLLWALLRLGSARLKCPAEPHHYPESYLSKTEDLTFSADRLLTASVLPETPTEVPLHPFSFQPVF